MKKLISFLIAFLLVLTTAFADTVNDPNLQPVPDSSIQSSNWTQYIPAEGEGVSGASIMQDNSSDNTLTRKWVYEGGYTSVSETIPVASTVWVQSSQYVPPVTQQVWVPPVTQQVWVPPVTHQEEIVDSGFVAVAWNGYWLDSGSFIYGPNGSEYSLFYGNGTYGTRLTDIPHTDYPRNEFTIYGPTGSYPYHCVWDSAIVHTGQYKTVIDQPGYWQTVVVQPGYYQTVVVQPGYYKDTSHWETTTTYQTKQDMVYTVSPHWTEYESIIPQYQLKN